MSDLKFFLKVVDRRIALVKEYEGEQVGPISEDGKYQVFFPLVGMRILSPGGIVEGYSNESWSHTPRTARPILLASL